MGLHLTNLTQYDSYIPMSETAQLDHPPAKLPDLTDYANGSDDRSKDIPLSLLIDLRKRGLSYRQIGKVAGCSHVNVLDRLKDYIQDIDQVDSFNRNRGDVLAIIQHKIVKSLTSDDIKNSSMRDRVVSMGILHDKERLERGLSTANIAVDSVIHNLHQNMFSNKPKMLNNQADDTMPGAE